MEHVEKVKTYLEDLLLQDFKDKPITPENLEAIKKKAIQYMGIEGPQIEMEVQRGRDANEVSIVPANMYTFVAMCGLEEPPHNMSADLREYSGEHAIYKLYDSRGKKNPVVLPKVTLTHITVTVGMKDEGTN